MLHLWAKLNYKDTKNIQEAIKKLLWCNFLLLVYGKMVKYSSIRWPTNLCKNIICQVKDSQWCKKQRALKMYLWLQWYIFSMVIDRIYSIPGTRRTVRWQITTLTRFQFGPICWGYSDILIFLFPQGKQQTGGLCSGSQIEVGELVLRHTCKWCYYPHSKSYTSGAIQMINSVTCLTWPLLSH